MAKSIDYRNSLKVLKKDPVMAGLIKRHGAPNIATYYGEITMFEALLRAIVYQQLSGKAAKAIHSRILALFPREVPTPEALLNPPAGGPTPQRLRACGLSIAKIEYVRDLARKFLDGTIDEKRFPKMTSQEIIDHLVTVKGIGEWTAQMMLIFKLHRFDILPVGDLAIRKGFQRAYKLKSEPKKKQMEKLAEKWRDHASVASWYLWREMDGMKVNT